MMRKVSPGGRIKVEKQVEVQKLSGRTTGQAFRQSRTVSTGGEILERGSTMGNANIIETEC